MLLGAALLRADQEHVEDDEDQEPREDADEHPCRSTGLCRCRCEGEE
jgi:hypothetical protein